MILPDYIGGIKRAGSNPDWTVRVNANTIHVVTPGILQILVRGVPHTLISYTLYLCNQIFHTLDISNINCVGLNNSV